MATSIACFSKSWSKNLSVSTTCVTPTVYHRNDPIQVLLPSSSSSSLRFSSTFFSFRGFSLSSVTPKYKSPLFLPLKLSIAESQKSNAIVEVFENEELPVSLAKYVADVSNKFTTERGVFTVCLSGGSLISYIRKLLELPYVGSLEWSMWHVFWVDERVVPKTHEDSNYKLAYDGLLSKVPIPLGNVYAINDALSVEGAAEDHETCLKQLVQNGVIASSSVIGFPKSCCLVWSRWPCSIFPEHPLLEENKKWVTFIKDSPKPPPERITFTFSVINSYAYTALVVTDVGKSDAVPSVLHKSQNSPKLPVASFT